MRVWAPLGDKAGGTCFLWKVIAAPQTVCIYKHTLYVGTQII